MSEEYAPDLPSISPESVAEDISEFFIGAQRLQRRHRARVRVRVRARPAARRIARPPRRPMHVAPPRAPALRRPAVYAQQEEPAGAWEPADDDEAYGEADQDEAYDAFRDTMVGARIRRAKPKKKDPHPHVIPAGWYRPRADLIAIFKKKKGRDPDEGDLGRLAYIASYTKGGIRAGNESTFENGYQMLGYFLNKGSLPPQKLVNPGGVLAERARAIVQQHIHAYHQAHRGFFDRINPVKAVVAAAKWAGRAVGTVAHVAGAAIHSAADVLGHIPIVGGPLHDVLGAANPFAVIESISKGERIDKAVLGDLKNKLGAVKAIAPYAATVASLVPGVGSGVAAALTAATALASGRNITDALIEGVKGAIPGGPAARTAFETAVSLSKGNRIDKALLDAARAQLPAEARAAFDTGLAVVNGQNLQKALTEGVKGVAADKLGDLAKEGDKLVGASKLLDKVRAIVPAHEREGFNLGMGVMSRSGVTPRALLTIRQRLQPHQRLGFDKALHTRTAQAQLTAKRIVKRVARGVPGTIVIRSHDPKKNGRQVSGRWRAARPGKGVQGILVQGKVQRLGWWSSAA